MSTSVGSLHITLGANASALMSGLSKAGAKVAEFARDLTSKLNPLGDLGIGGMFGGFGRDGLLTGGLLGGGGGRGQARPQPLRLPDGRADRRPEAGVGEGQPGAVRNQLGD
jgi:hypothetical protein